ncbi:MAG: RIP metalloprotease RseP [Candidatus Marinimicrobia bacterium]|nr:RIP metalloprotease RseP [Candidatus Neomarinimicrobiota bacterium]|tara:strand:- start:4355 stop:5422 length:1068 start_codon:yes stop_codon:yes gene_type:complete
MIFILSFIILLSVLVFVHELGHYMAARSVGMRVEKFYIGYNLFGLGIKKMYNETEYGIGLFPLGGYVKVAGVIDESLDPNSTGGPDEFNSKSPLQKIWFLSAGVIMNMLLAFFVFSFITFNLGIGEIDNSSKIGNTVANFPAESIGIQSGDEIIEINSKSISTWDELTSIIYDKPNEIIELKWKRNDEIISGSVRTKANERLIEDEIREIGMIGIGPVVTQKEVGLLHSLSDGYKKTVYWFVMTVKSLSMIFTGSASLDDIGGPIMIAKMAGESAKAGIWNWLNLMAIISINLAFLNILPIPGLDGGHIFFTAIEGIIQRDLPVRLKLGIQQFGMLLLFSLMIIVIYNDIARLFN